MLLSSIPIILAIVILAALWHWAAEVLRELRSISRSLGDLSQSTRDNQK